MKNIKRIMSFILVLVMVASLIGCQNNNDNNNSNSKSENTNNTSKDTTTTTTNNNKANNDEETNNNAKDDSYGPNEMPLPFGDGEELTLYVFIQDGARQVYESLKEHPVTKEVEKQTGLKLSFMHPPQGDDGTFFNTTIASGEYPDLFQNSFNTYPGGPDGAVEDGILINMNDLIDQYAPTFLSLVEERGDNVERKVRSDSGLITRFGTILQPPFLDGKVHRGILLRRDLLEKTGLEAPETIDEFTQVFRAFKELGVEYPFVLTKASDWMWRSTNTFAGAYGVTLHGRDGFYLEDDKKTVAYSYTQEGYKQFIETLNMWYEEGLISQDMPNLTHNDALSLMSGGRTGGIITGNWKTKQVLTLGQSDNPDFDVIATVAPSLEKGTKDKYANILESANDRAWFVSSTCENPELAVKLIEYFHLEEVNRMFAWGTEDSGTYEVVDGKRVFTEFMTNNKDMDYPTARDRYTMNPFQTMWDQEMEIQQYDHERNLETWDIWGSYGANNECIINSSVSLTPDESREFAQIMNQINTLSEEKFYQYVTGIESTDTFDDFVKTVKEMGLEKAQSIMQTAYDRYLAR